MHEKNLTARGTKSNHFAGARSNVQRGINNHRRSQVIESGGQISKQTKGLAKVRRVQILHSGKNRERDGILSNRQRFD